ncbi:MAG: nitrous oxide reductase family maturation protein NosD, partial [Gemmatimonadetes bacterium]|nr:nitrous oxide reductase family maturation protein NosD [Gemmatimonadota bacterium]NIU52124.1 nitrous oxide reductase family maturation protein NosD [Gemmatimonadota bacterium]NIW36564.1 nitrous oxide reductase family maturation protein NosD [Gemmatimonadota bacterium]NIY43332.1 nitrous oxide reductase family maturation protein NosD [Gemmatimonadota bacterium]
FRSNLVTDGRYGLHYMYSSDNLFERNEFARNDVAAFIMYSSDIVLRRNVFAQASGHSGFGIGLKDA